MSHQKAKLTHIHTCIHACTQTLSSSSHLLEHVTTRQIPLLRPRGSSIKTSSPSLLHPSPLALQTQSRRSALHQVVGLLAPERQAQPGCEEGERVADADELACKRTHGLLSPLHQAVDFQQEVVDSKLERSSKSALAPDEEAQPGCEEGKGIAGAGGVHGKTRQEGRGVAGSDDVHGTWRRLGAAQILLPSCGDDPLCIGGRDSDPNSAEKGGPGSGALVCTEAMMMMLEDPERGEVESQTHTRVKATCATARAPRQVVGLSQGLGCDKAAGVRAGFGGDEVGPQVHEGFPQPRKQGLAMLHSTLAVPLASAPSESRSARSWQEAQGMGDHSSNLEIALGTTYREITILADVVDLQGTQLKVYHRRYGESSRPGAPPITEEALMASLPYNSTASAGSFRISEEAMVASLSLGSHASQYC